MNCLYVFCFFVSSNHDLVTAKEEAAKALPLLAFNKKLLLCHKRCRAHLLLLELFSNWSIDAFNRLKHLTIGNDLLALCKLKLLNAIAHCFIRRDSCIL